MHFSPSGAANVVTNFMGTAFLLALLGGFLADAFLTSYCIYPISTTIEFAGLFILALQAHISSLKLPICTSTNRSTPCEHVDGEKKALLFFGLYLLALGVGGIKGSLPLHGDEQFDENTPKGRKQISTFFNYYVFCRSCGVLIAVTFVVWIEDNKGWQWGFGISTATILISIPIFLLRSTIYRIKIPAGSPMTAILKVGSQNITTIYNTCISGKSSNAVVSMNTNPSSTTDTSVAECHAKENAQIQTVHQLSLPVFPVLFMIVLAPVYNHIIIPFFRKVTKTEMSITHLQRIGTGLVLSIVAMAVAAPVEIKRKQVATQTGLCSHPLVKGSLLKLLNLKNLAIPRATA
ncbi:nitrate transporter 1:2 [Actinidia rufa]|uniref:Nitrate transporter 1:2 n=1 Tax=Actinidia rufa TaxID=165716 RepID=A0A7J0FY66_9ERIC|nr:nitrate transporter 1:2 [Actinidia rufa]